jgi:hypothetical protein
LNQSENRWGWIGEPSGRVETRPESQSRSSWSPPTSTPASSPQPDPPTTWDSSRYPTTRLSIPSRAELWNDCRRRLGALLSSNDSGSSVERTATLHPFMQRCSKHGRWPRSLRVRVGRNVKLAGRWISAERESGCWAVMSAAGLELSLGVIHPLQMMLLHCGPRYHSYGGSWGCDSGVSELYKEEDRQWRATRRLPSTG